MSLFEQWNSQSIMKNDWTSDICISDSVSTAGINQIGSGFYISFKCAYETSIV